jgi:hypothetical protein
MFSISRSVLPLNIRFYLVAIWAKQSLLVKTSSAEYELNPVKVVQEKDAVVLHASHKSGNVSTLHIRALAEDSVFAEFHFGNTFSSVIAAKWHKRKAFYFIPFSILSTFVSAEQADLNGVLLADKWILHAIEQSPTTITATSNTGEVFTFDFKSRKVTAADGEVSDATLLYPIPVQKKSNYHPTVDAPLNIHLFLSPEDTNYKYEHAFFRNVEALGVETDPVQQAVRTKIMFRLAKHNRYVLEFRDFVLTQAPEAEYWKKFSKVFDSYEQTTSLRDRKQLSAKYIAQSVSVPDILLARSYFDKKSIQFLFEFHYPSIGIFVAADSKHILEEEIKLHLAKEWALKTEDEKAHWYFLSTISQDNAKTKRFRHEASFHLAAFLQYVQDHTVQEFYDKTNKLLHLSKLFCF